MADVKLELHIDEVLKDIKDEAEKRMTAAVNAVRVEAVTSISKPGISSPGQPPSYVSGFLSSHIVGVVGTTRSGVVIGKVGTAVHYAPWLEYPLNRPWLRPAFENTKGQVQEIFSTNWF